MPQPETCAIAAPLCELGQQRWQTTILGLLGCAAVFFACVVLYTRHNSFPTVYHPDEFAKGRGIIGGGFKFTQPLLLTSTTGIVSWISGRHATVQEAVVVGRWVSAIFAALAIVLLAMAAAWQYGRWAGMAVAIALMSSHRLLVWAHYMKEDTALLLGLAVFLLTATLYWHRPTPRNLLILGMSCGLSIAGKYIGVLTIPLAWYVARAAERRDGVPSRAESRRRLWLFLAGCAGFLLIVQLPALRHPLDFLDDVFYEIRHPLTGHRGLSQPILWRSPFLRMYLFETPWWIIVPAGLYVAAMLARWRSQDVPRRLAVLFFGAYALCLLCSSIAEPRHLLPVVALSYFFAGLAIGGVAAVLPGGSVLRVPALALTAAALLWPFARYTRIYIEEFRQDTRAELLQWVRTKLGPDDAILAENYVGLPADESIQLGAFSEADRLKQHVEVCRFVPKAGSMEALHAEGWKYVAVAEPNYERYFDPAIRPSKRERAEYEQRRQEYQRLFDEAVLVFEAKPAIPMHSNTSPVVRVYRLRRGRVTPPPPEITAPTSRTTSR